MKLRTRKRNATSINVRTPVAAIISGILIALCVLAILGRVT